MLLPTGYHKVHYRWWAVTFHNTSSYVMSDTFHRVALNK